MNGATSALGFVTLPIPFRDHRTGSIIAGRAAAHISEIECVHVDELQGEISRFLDGGIADHQRFCAKIMATKEYGVSAMLHRWLGSALNSGPDLSPKYP
jgi:hypothetical protein